MARRGSGGAGGGSVWGRMGRAVGRFFGARKASYDAAKDARSRDGWTKSPVGPRALSVSAGLTLRARARDMTRNDPHIARAVEVIAGSVVGTGIEPRAVDAKQTRRSGSLQKKADAIWQAWAERGVADIEGQHTLGALTGVCARAWIESGEVFVRRIFDPSIKPVPIRLQVLEADMLDDTQTGTRGANGNRIEQGIEIDAMGRRAAYWFRTQHPGEAGFWAPSGSGSVRVPAEDVIHLFLPLRPGQLRGVPFPAPIMGMKRDLSDFEMFELARKKTEALVVAFVTPGDNAAGADEDDDSLAPTVEDANGDPVGVLESGAILSTPNGKEIRFNTPVISANYDVYKRAMLQSIAVGLQMTYENLTGDLSNVSYISYRAGHIQFNAYIDRLQWNHFIPVLMDTLWRWAMSGAYLVGALPTRDVPHEWAVPKRISVDPGADALADILEIRAGLALLDDKQAERGYQPGRLLEAIKATKEALKEADIILDSDPSKMAFRGAFPPAAQGTAIESSVDAKGGAATDKVLAAVADLRRAYGRMVAEALGPTAAPLNGTAPEDAQRAA